MAAQPGDPALSWPLGAALTFVATASVLVLEIAAGRLLARYVGVSLTTYTGIIGAILAGIAVGAWLGGRAADTFGPRGLLGPRSCSVGSRRSRPSRSSAGTGRRPWRRLRRDRRSRDGRLRRSGGDLVRRRADDRPRHVDRRGDQRIDRGPALGDRDRRGDHRHVPDRFRLLGLVPTRALIVAVGGLLVVVGLALTIALRGGGGTRAAALAIAALATGGLALAGPSTCDTESAYYCISVVADRDDMDGRTLILDA